MNERLNKVLHDIIDALGAGHGHLHAAVDDASRAPAATDSQADHAAATGNDDASGGIPAS